MEVTTAWLLLNIFTKTQSTILTVHSKSKKDMITSAMKVRLWLGWRNNSNRKWSSILAIRPLSNVLEEWTRWDSNRRSTSKTKPIQSSPFSQGLTTKCRRKFLRLVLMPYYDICNNISLYTIVGNYYLTSNSMKEGNK